VSRSAPVPHNTGYMAEARVLRWFRFNAVGLGGVFVQLGCLTLLVRGFGMHYLPATLLAVEAAVVHNFVWHQRWTWKDRPVSGWRPVAARFARFQALNGAISLAVNSGAMIALAGMAGLDPLLAGGAAILASSVVNFLASETLVFERRGVAPGCDAGPVHIGSAVVAACIALAPTPALAQPDHAVLSAWAQYQTAVDDKYDRSASGHPFFALDALDAAGSWRTAVRQGGISMREIDAPVVNGARIHHWAGAMFVPATTVAALVERLQRGAGDEARLYEDVIDSRLLARDGDRVRVFMKLRRTTILTATFNTEHDVQYRRLGPARASSRSVSTKIAELADAGTPRERERAAGDDRGFLWRLNAYWRFEQAGDGVIVECESVSLSRSVPTLLRPVAGPIVTRVARESLEKTLSEMRAVIAAPR
jgi:putative flippase GtrA